MAKSLFFIDRKTLAAAVCGSALLGCAQGSLAAPEVVVAVPEPKSNAAALAAAGDPRKHGATALAGVRLGSLLGEYPACEPRDARLCWAQAELAFAAGAKPERASESGSLEVFAFKNIPLDAPDPLRAKQEPIAIVELAGGRIEKIAIRFSAKNASEAPEVSREARAFASAKWSRWARSIREDGFSSVWQGPKGLVATVNDVPSQPGGAVVSLSTRDYDALHAIKR